MVPPNHPILIGIFHYKPSILGYHYFWKHPYDILSISHYQIWSKTDGILVHADIQVHLQELDRILHRKVEGDADFPFGTLKSAAETPNRTGDEIVVFFFTHFCFQRSHYSSGGR